MTRIPFTRSPAFATVVEGLTLAAAYWRASVERWERAALALTHGSPQCEGDVAIVAR